MNHDEESLPRRKRSSTSLLVPPEKDKFPTFFARQSIPQKRTWTYLPMVQKCKRSPKEPILQQLRYFFLSGGSGG
jgi:hypothetical protein